MKKLKAQHFEALLAWEGFDALQHGKIPEKIIHQASLVYAQEKQASSRVMEKEIPLCPIREQAVLENTASSQESAATISPMTPICLCAPVYVSYFDIYGRFLGCFVQGYQMSQVIQPASAVQQQQGISLDIFDTLSASPASPVAEDDLDSEGSYFSELLWEFPRRRAIRFYHQRKAPTVLHLGKKSFQGQTYGLDLVTLLSASTSETLHFHASLKLLEAPESGEAYLVCFGKENLPVYHDFSSCHVCVSPLLTVPLETLTDPKGALSLSVTILSLY